MGVADQLERALFDGHGRVDRTVVDEQRHRERITVFGCVEIGIFKADRCEVETEQARYDVDDAAWRADDVQVFSGRHRNLLATGIHGRAREHLECDVPILMRHHRGDPCAFRFCVQADLARVHALLCAQQIEPCEVVFGA